MTAPVSADHAARATESGPYGDDVIRQLNALTSEFYAREAASFSATRQAPWHGWEQAWNTIFGFDPAFAARPLSVLDLGCGNLRFERFLTERAADPLSVHAVDNCAALAQEGIGLRETSCESDSPHPAGGYLARALSASNAGAAPSAPVTFQELDIVEALLIGTFAERLPRVSCDVAVAFGVMHHLATFEHRAAVLESLVASLRPGGFAVVSFWQFLNDPRLAAKAEATTADGRARHRLPPLGSGDVLLGWQHAENVFRFCHHTSDSEIDALLSICGIVRQDGTAAGESPVPADVSLREIARFSADGKTGDLNRYLVLQRP